MKESRTQTERVRSLTFLFRFQISSFRLLFYAISFLFYFSFNCSLLQSSLFMMIWKSSSAYYLGLLIIKRLKYYNYSYAIQYFKQLKSLYIMQQCKQQYVQFIIRQYNKIKKMSIKSPNTLTLNAYVQNSQQKISYELESVNNESIEQQIDRFSKQLHYIDSILNIFSKNVEIAANQVENKFITDFYPQFVLDCRYDDDQQKKSIGNSHYQLMKILMSLQKGNSVLKQQLKGWYFQFAKKTKYTQALISENQVLRKFVSKKNKQIIKLIESINSVENVQLMTIQQRLNELKQQNGILKDHLVKIKQKSRDRESHLSKLLKALDDQNKRHIDLQQQMKVHQDQQEHIAKSQTLNNENQKQYIQRQKYLIRQIDRLVRLKKQYNEDRREIERQLAQCQIDRKDIDGFLKSKYDSWQEQKQKLNFEIQTNSDNYHNIRNQNKELQEQINKNENKLAQYIKNNEILQNKIKQTSILLSSHEKQQKQITDTQISVNSAIDLLDIQIKQLREQIQASGKQQEIQRQKLNAKLKQFQQMKNDQIKKWSLQLQKNRKNAYYKIEQQNNTIQVQNQQIQSVQSQILNANTTIKNLMAELKLVKRQAFNLQPHQKLFKII